MNAIVQAAILFNTSKSLFKFYLIILLCVSLPSPHNPAQTPAKCLLC